MSTAMWMLDPPEGLLDEKIELGDNGRSVLEQRYLRADVASGRRETVEELFWRVASTVAAARAATMPARSVVGVAVEYYGMLRSLRFIPNSPTFTGANTPLGQLAACYVLPISDDLGGSDDSIFGTLRSAMLIQQSGGGVGFDFSELRQCGDNVESSNGPASGPISFIGVYSKAIEVTAQGGIRSGANMAVLRVDHPDIDKFIACKTAERQLANFNMSVGATDEFMTAAVEGREYDIVAPRTRTVCRRESASAMLDAIAASACRNGEPGIIFLDTANRANAVPKLYTLAATNPCGEQFLGPYESCCLGSINLVQHMCNDDKSLDWVELRKTIQAAVCFLDDVIDANHFIPTVPKLAAAARATRRIGVGFMGLADILFRMRIRFGSPEALDFSDELAEFIRYEAMGQSVRLSSERGPFPAFRGSIYDPDVSEAARQSGDACTAGCDVGTLGPHDDDGASSSSSSSSSTRRDDSASASSGAGGSSCSSECGSECGGECGSESVGRHKHHPYAVRPWRPPAPARRRSAMQFGRPQIDWDRIVEGIRYHGIRNAATVTIAPTGTIATVAGCEGYGCEPVYSLAYRRRVLMHGTAVEQIHTNAAFEAALASAGESGIPGATVSKIIADVAANGGSCRSVADLPDDIRTVFVTALVRGKYPSPMPPSSPALFLAHLCTPTLPHTISHSRALAYPIHTRNAHAGTNGAQIFAGRVGGGSHRHAGGAATPCRQ